MHDTAITYTAEQVAGANRVALLIGLAIGTSVALYVLGQWMRDKEESARYMTALERAVIQLESERGRHDQKKA